VVKQVKRIEGKPVWKWLAANLLLLLCCFILSVIVWSSTGSFMDATSRRRDPQYNQKVLQVYQRIDPWQESAAQLSGVDKKKVSLSSAEVVMLLVQGLRKLHSDWYRLAQHLIAAFVTYILLGLLAGFMGIVNYSWLLPVGNFLLTLRGSANPLNPLYALGDSPFLTAALIVLIQMLIVSLVAQLAANSRELKAETQQAQ
jgi:hypothetical protein